MKFNLYVINFKKNIIPFIFILFTLSLLIFSNSNIPAISKALNLWFFSVVPALFPFFVATELLVHTNIVNSLGIYLNKFMKPLFNINGNGSFAFLMGIISGYPIGAKIACEFRKQNLCSKEECERLLSFTNNSGPLFIIGTVGITMFNNTSIGLLLFITHLLASITVGFLFKYWKRNIVSTNHIKNTVSNSNINCSFSNLGEILSESIIKSIHTIVLIGGFIVIFSIIINILNVSGIFTNLQTLLTPIFTSLNINSEFILGILTGFLEITNGINLISSVNNKIFTHNIVIASFLLGIGGICIFLQVLSIISKSDLSPKPYIYGKILHAIFSSIYTYIFILILPFLNFNL